MSQCHWSLGSFSSSIWYFYWWRFFLSVYKQSQCTYNQEYNSLWVHFDFNDSPLIKSVRSVLQLPHPVGTHKRSVQLPTVRPLHPRPGGDDRPHWGPTQEPGGQSEHWSWYDFCTSLFNSIKCPFYLISLGYGDSPKFSHHLLKTCCDCAKPVWISVNGYR